MFSVETVSPPPETRTSEALSTKRLFLEQKLWGFWTSTNNHLTLQRFSELVESSLTAKLFTLKSVKEF